MFKSVLDDLYQQVRKQSYTPEPSERKLSSSKHSSKQPSKQPSPKAAEHPVMNIFQPLIEERSRSKTVPLRPASSSFYKSALLSRGTRKVTDHSENSSSKIESSSHVNNVPQMTDSQKILSRFQAVKVPHNINTDKQLIDVAKAKGKEKQEETLRKHSPPKEKTSEVIFPSSSQKNNKSFSKLIASPNKSYTRARSISRKSNKSIDSHDSFSELHSSLNNKTFSLAKRRSNGNQSDILESNPKDPKNISFNFANMKVVQVKQISRTGIPKKVENKSPENNKKIKIPSIIQSSVQTIKQSFSNSNESKGTLGGVSSKLNRKPTKIGKAQPKFYVFSGFATIDERDRMSSFLQNEFMNEMLLNRFNMDLDKFQIKDTIAEINKKTIQNKTLRHKFYDFVNKGGLSESRDFKQDPLDAPSPRQSVKMPNLDLTRTSMRKVSENLNSDGSINDHIINIDEGDSKEIGITEETITQLKEMRKKEKNHTHDPTVVRSLKLDGHGGTPRVLNTAEEIDEKQHREMNIIRLVKERELLNQKFSKSIAGKQRDNREKEEALSLAKVTNEKDKSYIFIKAASEGDYDAVKYYLQQKNAFVFDHDLVLVYLIVKLIIFENR